MISESPRSRNPAGHAGLLENLLALVSALVEFFESRFALLAQESKVAAVQLLRRFREQPISWLTTAAAVGALVALAPIQKKKIYVDANNNRKSKKKLVEAGFAVAVLKIVARLARPVIVEFVKNRLTDFGGQSRRKT